MTVEAEKRVHRAQSLRLRQVDMDAIEIKLAREHAYLKLLRRAAVNRKALEFSVGIIDSAVERLLQVSLVGHRDLAYFSELGVTRGTNVALE